MDVIFNLKILLKKLKIENIILLIYYILVLFTKDIKFTYVDSYP